MEKTHSTSWLVWTFNLTTNRYFARDDQNRIRAKVEQREDGKWYALVLIDFEAYDELPDDALLFSIRSEPCATATDAKAIAFQLVATQKSETTKLRPPAGTQPPLIPVSDEESAFLEALYKSLREKEGTL